MIPGVISTAGAAAMSASPPGHAATLAVTTISSVYRGALGGAVTTISSMTKSGACHAGGLSARAVADKQTITAAPQNSLVAFMTPSSLHACLQDTASHYRARQLCVPAETWRNPKRVSIILKRSGGPADETIHGTVPVRSGRERRAGA